MRRTACPPRVCLGDGPVACCTTETRNSTTMDKIVASIKHLIPFVVFGLSLSNLIFLWFLVIQTRGRVIVQAAITYRVCFSLLSLLCVHLRNWFHRGQKTLRFANIIAHSTLLSLDQVSFLALGILYLSNVFHTSDNDGAFSGFLLLGMIPLVAAIGLLFYVAEPLYLEVRRLADGFQHANNMSTTLGGIRNAVLFIGLVFMF
ncbi:hypothetical protein PROFUN_13596 [Planoprotostelium fungivorum]|uniref:Uncharacterized protein n=1 Tax=Planoprotostelium fungivorum TaxID=1890364 RepID=A0A2P6N3K0_9EUKA|nr:hypothetical protein PROFUN_13596 [Planoprotostelium fungivorum]